MIYKCCAVECSHTSKTCKLVTFPSDLEKRKLWEANICRNNWNPEPSDKICECHFEDAVYETGQNNAGEKIKDDAIPTVFATHSVTDTHIVSSYLVVNGESLGPVKDEPASEDDLEHAELLIIPQPCRQLSLKKAFQCHPELKEKSREFKTMMIRFPQVEPEVLYSVMVLHPKEEWDNIMLECEKLRESSDNRSKPVMSVRKVKKRNKNASKKQELIDKGIKQEDDAADLNINVKSFESHQNIASNGMRIRRSSRLMLKSAVNRSTRSKNITVKNRRHICNICGSRFLVPCKLKLHLMVHSGEKPFKCKYCEKSFNNNSNLKKHERVHTGVKPYECKQCGAKFSNGSNLTKHMWQHTGEKPFKCSHPGCAKAFRTSTTMLTHKANIHMPRDDGDNSKPGSHVCTICQKVCSNKYHLKLHTMVHTGEKPHECTFCKKRFRIKFGLTEHIRSHTGEKPYQCNLCGKRFAFCSSYKTHTKLHSVVYQCKICSLKMPERSALARHLFVHTGAKPLECTYCDKIYFQLPSLKRHLQSHINV